MLAPWNSNIFTDNYVKDKCVHWKSSSYKEINEGGLIITGDLTG